MNSKDSRGSGSRGSPSMTRLSVLISVLES